MIHNTVFVVLFSYVVNAHLCGDKLNPRCQCSSTVMDCRNQSLEAFLSDEFIGKELKSLYLNANYLTKISQIPERKYLTYINLADNSIKEIETDSFDNLDELTTLVLSNNNISVIVDDTFEWNPLKLQVLYLDGNQLEFVQHFLFYDLEELTELYLQNNQISFIHPNSFLQLTKLRRLRLDGNQLHTFIPNWIKKLQPVIFGVIRLDNNPWSCDCDMIPAIEWSKDSGVKWFHDITTKFPLVCKQPLKLNGTEVSKLVESDVKDYCNKPVIKQVSRSATIPMYKDVLIGCVAYADDEHLPVASISWTAPNQDTYRLQNAYSFQGIEVHQNGSLKIRNFTKDDAGTYTCVAKNKQGIFEATTELKLDQTLKPSSPPSTNEEKTRAPMKIAEEPPAQDDWLITDLATYTCPVECSCISQHIDCASDTDNKKPFKVMPADIPKTAYSISIAFNKLESVVANQFEKFTHVEEINMDNNEISSIALTAFSRLIFLKTLTLRHNMLTMVSPHVFKDLEKLSVLMLDDNAITRISKDSFVGLKALKWLYIRNNHISTIEEGAFKHLLLIKFIHLEGNLFQHFPISSIEDVIYLKPPTIKKIFVDENFFICDCNMENIRQFVQSSKEYHEIFADGIQCHLPQKFNGKYLGYINETLECDKTNISANFVWNGTFKLTLLIISAMVLLIGLAFVVVIITKKRSSSSAVLIDDIKTLI